MPITVATSPTLGDANSYVLLSWADDYHEAMAHTVWATYDDDRKEWLLRVASSLLDARYTWATGTYLAVPRSLQIATAEVALFSAASGFYSEQTIKEVQVGQIDITFESARAPGALTGLWEFIDALLTGLGTVVAVAGETGGWGLLTVTRG